MDYLAEITMSLLARARVKQPDARLSAPISWRCSSRLAPDLAARGIRVVANAGGVNPTACRDALEAALDVDRRDAEGRGRRRRRPASAAELRCGREKSSGAPIPAKLLSMNAYLGALPIAAALDAGADIVITGRCVDSAVVLGPLIHRSAGPQSNTTGWRPAAWPATSIECGTAGDRRRLHRLARMCPAGTDMGYPIVECHPDGSFVLTKPPGTGGLVSPATVAEQIVYEIGDPARYILPDVICDFRHVTTGPRSGRTGCGSSGARGLPPTSTYKASAQPMRTASAVPAS